MVSNSGLAHDPTVHASGIVLERHHSPLDAIVDRQLGRLEFSQCHWLRKCRGEQQHGFGRCARKLELLNSPHHIGVILEAHRPDRFGELGVIVSVEETRMVLARRLRVRVVQTQRESIQHSRHDMYPVQGDCGEGRGHRSQRLTFASRSISVAQPLVVVVESRPQGKPWDRVR
jgi:hypothetical protein